MKPGGPGAWRTCGAHIPGARYGRPQSRPVGARRTSHRPPIRCPRRKFSPAAWGAMGIGNDTQVVAYDEANGSIAARLWWMLRWLGHDAAGRPRRRFQGVDCSRRERCSRARADPAAAERVGAPFHAADRRGLRREHGGTRARIAGPEGPCWSMRAPQERYAGAVEPIDPVAGPRTRRREIIPLPTTSARDGRFFCPPPSSSGRWQERLPRQRSSESGRHVRLPASPPVTICSASRWPASPAASCTPDLGASGFAIRGGPLSRG